MAYYHAWWQCLHVGMVHMVQSELRQRTYAHNSHGTVWTKSVIFLPFIRTVHAVVLESHALVCTLQPCKWLTGQALLSPPNRKVKYYFSLAEHIALERI